jgi:hypothetical protein
MTADSYTDNCEQTTEDLGMTRLCLFATIIALLCVAPIAQAQQQIASPGTPAETVKTDTITVGLDRPLPPWCDDIAATDQWEGSQSGPSGASTVYLGSGVYQNNPADDADVYNPTGPRAQFCRMYRTSHAANGTSSPGFPTGWTHGYDNTITAAPGSGWQKLSFNWYNGAKEELIPETKDGSLTGRILTANKPPYMVTGKPAADKGRWEWMMISFADTDKWTFGPDASNPDIYRLRRISETVGKPIDFYYDQSGRISQITQSDAKPLVKFEYDSSGLMSLITPFDANGKPYGKVRYFYGQAAGAVNLTGVSEIGAPDTPFWRYGYVALGGRPFLNAVGMPSPTGAKELAVGYVNYDAQGRVSALVDANKNQRCYTYGEGQVKVEVKNPSGHVDGSHTQKIGK